MSLLLRTTSKSRCIWNTLMLVLVTLICRGLGSVTLPCVLSHLWFRFVTDQKNWVCHLLWLCPMGRNFFGANSTFNPCQPSLCWLQELHKIFNLGRNQTQHLFYNYSNLKPLTFKEKDEVQMALLQCPIKFTKINLFWAFYPLQKCFFLFSAHWLPRATLNMQRAPLSSDTALGFLCISQDY